MWTTSSSSIDVTCRPCAPAIHSTFTRFSDAHPTNQTNSNGNRAMLPNAAEGDILQTYLACEKNVNATVDILMSDPSNFGRPGGAGFGSDGGASGGDSGSDGDATMGDGSSS